MSDIATLNHDFAIPGHLTFIEGPGGFIVARIHNQRANADIALQGAHILSFQPAGEAPVIWLSKQARYVPGKSIRGGIPVCWPWFGNHTSEASFPAHGFARTVDWDVTASETTADNSTRITFQLRMNDAAKVQWPAPCRLNYIVTVGKNLSMELVTENTGDASFDIGEALHTYFNIGNIGDIEITGLEGCEYLDKVEYFKRKTEPGAVTISSEVDRVYLNTTADCIIEDRKLQRRIRIAKTSSRSTVVWNPWMEKSITMGDMGEDGYRNMVCVESANAAENVVTVVPGTSHQLAVVYSVEKI